MKRRALAVVACCLALVLAGLQAGGIPQMINYQGILLDGDQKPVTGNRSVEFLLYDTETEGIALWSETQNVSVMEGLFAVLLGSIKPIPSPVFDSTTLYLTLKVGSDEEMLPRKLLVSVGYAYRALNADSLGGKGADEYVLSGDSGSVTAAMIAPEFLSSVDGVSNDGGDVDLVAGSNVTITPNDEANTITISAIGGGTSGDNLGNHTATRNIKLNGNFLSNDGDGEGIRIQNSGDVGISGTLTVSGDILARQQLDVSGIGHFSDNLLIDGLIYSPDGMVDISGIETGTIHSDALIIAEDNIISGGYVRAGAASSSCAAGDIAADDDVLADDAVVAGGNITSGGYVKAGTPTFVPSVGDIAADDDLMADDEVRSGGDMNCGDVLIAAGHCGINYGSYSMTYALRVSGDAYCSGSWLGSDLSLKKNVTPAVDFSSKLRQLRGVSFEWNREGYPDREFSKGTQYGLVAQEVEAVFPELVKTDENGEKAVNYSGLIPLLLEAVKEQHQTIDELKSQINELRAR
jgi:hypothetical protein